MDPARLALIRSGTKDETRSTGSGYLIGPRLVLTARHVLVNRETGELWPRISARIGHFENGPSHTVRAELLWTPADDLDVALLRVDHATDTPGVVWGRPAGRVPLPYQGLGYPKAAAADRREAEYLRGTLAPLSGSGRHYVLDQGPAPVPGTDGGNAWGGASGAAVFCGDVLVGVVVQEPAAYGARRLLAVPAHSFVQDRDFLDHLARHACASPELVTIGVPAPRAAPGTERTPTERTLEKLLLPLFTDPAARTAYARELAGELGYDTDDYAPTTADLVALLQAHPRAHAALGQALAPRVADPAFRSRLTAFLTQARALGCGPLLSPAEFDELLQLLAEIRREQPALLHLAAHDALPYAVLPDGLARPRIEEDELGPTIEALEELPDGERVPDGSPPVPALLRLVEYVGASVDGERQHRLRAWSQQTADRIGIHVDALRERRGDAAQWAKRRRNSLVSRVVMELEHSGTADGDRYRCRIRLDRADGTRRILKDPSSEPKTPQQAARALAEAVSAARQEPGQGDHVPWVTVVVDRHGLHLAVDEWEPGAPEDLLPSWPIGADYQVSFSCPEFDRIAADRAQDQERRWKKGRTAVLVTGPACGDSRKLMHLLRTEHRDTARAVLHGPADQRQSWLQVCLALGVPVVLWDRDATGYEDAERLGELAPAGELDGLAERVRVFRSHTAAHPEERRARPSLVWEPDSSHPRTEQLHLRDPWRGTHAS
ncbi:trypsin-like peptidase domain-containing protein [Streptomyces sp. R44]|uniref:Trypsin-like peptidase domain-containing protein n=1 Tax=Streptomyces sp. R44 TaxID=3238633 RepID=A0AB39T6D2_9ACTN